MVQRSRFVHRVQHLVHRSRSPGNVLHGAGHHQELDRTQVVSSVDFEKSAFAPTGVPRVHRQPVLAIFAVDTPSDQLHVLVSHQAARGRLVNPCSEDANTTFSKCFTDPASPHTSEARATGWIYKSFFFLYVDFHS